ncbi:hypothetical protein KCU93_g324, partial [Aureobasidium melanogenum]
MLTGQIDIYFPYRLRSFQAGTSPLVLLAFFKNAMARLCVPELLPELYVRSLRVATASTFTSGSPCDRRVRECFLSKIPRVRKPSRKPPERETVLVHRASLGAYHTINGTNSWRH